MDTIHNLYEKQIKPLPVLERLQLIQLVMDDLTKLAPRWVVETGDAWSQEDLYDLSRASLFYANKFLKDEEGDAEIG